MHFHHIYKFLTILFISFTYAFHTVWSRVMNIVDFTSYYYTIEIFMLMCIWFLYKIFVTDKQNKRQWIASTYLVLIRNYQKQLEMYWKYKRPWIRNIYLVLIGTEQKVFVFGDFLVHIFSYSDWIQRFAE